MLTLKNARYAIIICALGALSESLFYAALAPLLPLLDRQLGLGHELAGLLVAGYAIGYFLGTYPAIRLAQCIGPRSTAVTGILMVAVATTAFALGSQFALLLAARVMVGVGSAIAYTGLLAAAGSMARADHRGAAIGTVYSGSAAGSAIGPLVGALADTAGRDVVFATMAGLQVLIAGLLSRLPSVPRTANSSLRTMLQQLRHPVVAVGVWVTGIPAFGLGVLTVTGSYRLNEIGAGSIGISLAFSGIAAIGILVNPTIGRFSDRVGRRMPILLALLAASGTLVLLILAALEIPTVILIAATGAMLMAVGGPGLALIGDEIRRHGGDPAEATFLMNLGWGPSAALGAIIAGLAHGAVGAEFSLALLVGIALASAGLVHRYVRTVATADPAGR